MLERARRCSCSRVERHDSYPYPTLATSPFDLPASPPYREAKRTLPRPKVGDFCSTAMEQGFSDVCVAYCMNQVPVARVAQTCRSAAIEMPRPTVRKWCEHGYNVAYAKTLKDLKNYWKAGDDAARKAAEAKVRPCVCVLHVLSYMCANGYVCPVSCPCHTLTSLPPPSLPADGGGGGAR